ncbi:MAG: FAD-binding protein, partial [Hyphomicrobiaceae bacterium]
MKEALRPATDWELASMIVGFASRNQPFEVRGFGTKSRVGRPMQTAATITTQSLRGITLYEPTELVMSAQAGTPLAQIEAELAANGQMLAFEPIDLGPATGGQLGMQSIGGVFAANLSGSRRIVAGAARDHLIGAKGVNGRSEIFKSGGRVMKNVTGYDVARGLCGSWGTLAVLTEVTFKVLPWPEAAATLAYVGLPDDIAVELLAAAMGTPFEVSGSAHLSEALVRRLPMPRLSGLNGSLTLLRVENFAKSVAYRKTALREALKAYGAAVELDYGETLELWGLLRQLRMLSDTTSCLWRISTAPLNGPKVVSAIERHMQVAAFYDWSGGLDWLEVPASADAGASDIRRAVAVHGGHATLIRAEPQVRASVEV